MSGHAAAAPAAVAGLSPAARAVQTECAVKFKKTALCRYYPKCSKGAGCMYAHSEAELRKRPNVTKTRMCVGYTNGRCPLPADECLFAHGYHDLRTEDGRRIVLQPPVEVDISMFASGDTTPTHSGSSTPVSRQVSFSSNGSAGNLLPPPGLSAPPSVGDVKACVAMAVAKLHAQGPIGPNKLGLDADCWVLARWRL